MTSNAKYFRNIFVWLLILSCFMTGSYWHGYFREKIRQKKENYQMLWKKVNELERRCVDVPAAECRPSLGMQCECE